MQVVCFSKNHKLEELYPDFLHVKFENEIEKFEDFLLLFDVGMVLDETESFLTYLSSLSTCKKVFALSSKPNFTEGTHLLSLGVQGYGNIYMQPVHMLEAIESIKRGDIWLYPHFVQQMIKSFTQKSSLENRDMLHLLSPKEKEVANLVKEGLSNKEIALRLECAERTVKSHLTSIFEKLHVKDRLALALKLSTKVL